MGRKILLEHIDVPGINTYDVYRSKGGYSSVEKALKTMKPEDVVEEVFQVKLSERATRLIDGANEDSMEKKKREGYF